MDKIYKIYFDGEKVVANSVQYIKVREYSFVYEIYDEFENLLDRLDETVLNYVITYSLGNIVAYTLDEDKIEDLKNSVYAKLREYHSGQIDRKMKEVLRHIDNIALLSKID